MRIFGAILVVLGAWMFLAVPIALVMGRFLYAGSERASKDTSRPPQGRRSYNHAA